MFLKSRDTFFISFLGSLLLGAILWIKSAPPPYNFPGQEGNVYWMHLIDIAHKWREGRVLCWWDQGAGGGLSTFISCQYPVLNPLNAIAWILNDDDFCKFNLIMPYVTGFFFGCMLLRQIFQLGWAYTFLGSLTYLGLVLSRHTTLPESPLHLWGCFLMPMALWVYFSFAQKNRYLAVGMVGCILAFDFASSGATNFPQNFIWWICFLVINKENLLSVLILAITATGIFALQFVPLHEFAVHESGRQINSYALNSSLFKDIADIVTGFLTSPMGVSCRGILALLFMAMALGIAHGAKILRAIQGRDALVKISLATLLYILTPSILQALSFMVPALKHPLAPLTMFTFRYCINTVDLCLSLTLAVVLGQESFRLKNLGLPAPQKILTGFFIVLAWGAIAIPFLFERKLSTLLVFVVTAIGIICVTFRPKETWAKLLLGVSLTVLGFMTTITCFNWCGKGSRDTFGDYHTTSPEYRYFSQAKGQYFLPYDMPPEMGDIYPLAHGLKSTTGFYACPPIRFNTFLAFYHHDPLAPARIPVVHFELLRPSGALTTYFPVDFTTITHGNTLPWPGFNKIIDGERYDIWQRLTTPPQVLTAGHLAVLPFAKIIAGFDTPFNGNIAIEDKDADTFNLTDTQLPSGQVTINNWEYRGDKISFTAESKGGTFIMVPTMYQHGWQAWDNGQRTQVFPADYIFLGMHVPAGKHSIQMKFQPPELKLGLIYNIAALLLLVFLIIKYLQIDCV